MTIDALGRFGVWRGYQGVTPDDASELEQLGYGTVWLGGSPPAELPVVESLLAATETLTVATSIVNVWSAPAKTVAESYHRIEESYPGRFLLGVGVGHPEFNDPYRKPYEALVEYLDELDAAGVPKQRLALAALGPRVLELARDRTAGALPYLVTPEHSRRARAILGEGTLLAVEQKLVVEEDPERAREVGRTMVPMYLGLGNYVANLRRLGFDDADVATPGSDRLIDQLTVHGSAERVAEQLVAHLDAGADHVALQALGPSYLESLRALAPLLRA
ncbi:LLM class F420-dependent oxidoreductase [Nocardia bhagyanarayanae]|uniref:Putative F420-dependent oxidoreductase n=1 Tax=Nocardia bhagyanarayanae TaxID=1215925 RepID=A0A543F4H4_9NOCA|nr:LLM class F420-dependent oxidoreductase [Nocardia bhagyanarayanae]TQM28729.1 putative F420-dependent oxidoreductase [Nocardia bhagyanarayanae]